MLMGARVRLEVDAHDPVDPGPLKVTNQYQLNEKDCIR